VRLIWKAQQQFQAATKLTIQLTATYQSKTNLPVNQNSDFMGSPMMPVQSATQDYIKPNCEIDITIKKTFSEKRHGL